MITALADAGAALDEPRYLDAADRLRRVRPARPARRSTGGCCAPTTTARPRIGGYLEDHAFLLEALIVLFETTCRGALVHGGERPRGHADRPLRRSRERRLLLDRLRRRSADRAAQGPRGLPDPRRRLQRCARPAAPGSANGRAYTSATPSRVLRLLAISLLVTQPRSATCCRRCTGTSPPPARSPARSLQVEGQCAGVCVLSAFVRFGRQKSLASQRIDR